MPYRPIVIHRRVAISLAIVLAFLTGQALGACAGRKSGGAAQPTLSATPASAAPSASSDSDAFDPDTYVPRKIADSDLAKRFAYDRSRPLDVHVQQTRHQSGATIQTITYAVPGTDPVTAELVTAPGRGPGIVYAHGGAPGADQFLDEALAAVKHGGAAILPDIPITMTGTVATDITYVTEAVIAERRALDILVARSNVDPKRLAFVGHSWGAELAAIMAGAEPRLSAVAITCGWSRMSTDMADTAGITGDRKYIEAATVLDGFRFVGIKDLKRRVLIQYGTQDPNIPTAQRTELTHAAVGNVVRKDYDAGHDLIAFPQAEKDRLAFLGV
jgi:dienelactone hydrolase